MFVSSRQKLGLAMGILLGSMGTSANLSAADALRVRLSDVQNLGPSVQLAMHQVGQQATEVRPMLIHYLAGTGATLAVIDTGLSEQTFVNETPGGFLRCE